MGRQIDKGADAKHEAAHSTAYEDKAAINVFSRRRSWHVTKQPTKLTRTATVVPDRLSLSANLNKTIQQNVREHLLSMYQRKAEILSLVEMVNAAGVFDFVLVGCWWRKGFYILNPDSLPPDAKVSRDDRYSYLTIEEVGLFLSPDIECAEVVADATKYKPIRTIGGVKVKAYVSQPFGPMTRSIGHIVACCCEALLKCDKLERGRRLIDALRRNLSELLDRVELTTEILRKKETDLATFLAHDVKNKVYVMLDAAKHALDVIETMRVSQNAIPPELVDDIETVKDVSEQAKQMILKESTIRALVWNTYKLNLSIVEHSTCPRDLPGILIDRRVVHPDMRIRTDPVLVDLLFSHVVKNAQAHGQPPFVCRAWVCPDDIRARTHYTGEVRCDFRRISLGVSQPHLFLEVTNNLPLHSRLLTMGQRGELCSLFNANMSNTRHHSGGSGIWIILKCVRELGGLFTCRVNVCNGDEAPVPAPSHSSSVENSGHDDDAAVFSGSPTFVAQVFIPLDTVGETPSLPKDVRIFVLDDSALHRKMYNKTFSKHLSATATYVVSGSTLVEAESFADYVLHSDPPVDIVIVDNYLDYPESKRDGRRAFEGVNVARRLREAGTTATIFMRSANNSQDDIRKYMAAGAHGCIPKSIPQSAFIQELSVQMAKIHGVDWSKDRICSDCSVRPSISELSSTDSLRDLSNAYSDALMTEAQATLKGLVEDLGSRQFPAQLDSELSTILVTIKGAIMAFPHDVAIDIFFDQHRVPQTQECLERPFTRADFLTLTSLIHSFLVEVDILRAAALARRSPAMLTPFTRNDEENASEISTTTPDEGCLTTGSGESEQSACIRHG